MVALWYLRGTGCRCGPRHRRLRPGIALGHVIGRLGCFFAGCCYGRPTDVPWAVTFTNRYAAHNVGTPLNVPLHPTQLYEAGAELLILVCCSTLERKGRAFPGPHVLGLHAAVWRVALHHRVLSAATRAAAVGHFSTSQFISLLLVPLSIVMLVVAVAAVTPDTTGRGEARARAGLVASRYCPTATRHLVVEPDQDGLRARPVSRGAAAGPVALADPAADQGRPRPRRRPPAKAEHGGARRPESGVDIPAAGPRAPAAEALPLPIVYQDADRRGRRQAGRAWSCIRPPGTAAARWSTRCCTT